MYNDILFLVFEDTISLLTCSSCGKYLVAGDVQSSIAVWIKKGYKWEKYCKLPKYNSAPTALSMQPQTTILVVVYADKKVEFYLQSSILKFLYFVVY